LADRHSLSAQALKSACLEDLKIFRSGAPKTDDLTIMVMRRVE
jgi:serine phosphatase RsbU (regulator of sigma subunit)